MKVFISGGSKSGKSMYAQKIAKAINKKPLYYLATMIARDTEDENRISAHRNEREGWGFTTIETPYNILQKIEHCDFNGAFLLDSVTALLANEMFKPNEPIQLTAHEKLCNELIEMLSKINNIVIVSDCIYSDAILYDSATELYRKQLAHIGIKIASVCDVVIEASYGNLTFYKGEENMFGGFN